MPEGSKKSLIKKKEYNLGESFSQYNFPVIGIGGSAGSFDAFEKIIHPLPENHELSIVFISHLEPKTKSELADIFAKRTTLQVLSIKNNMKLEAGNIYIMRPDTEVVLFAGKFKVTRRNKSSKKPFLPIDTFLKSLAMDAKAEAKAIILSGMGNDGSAGIIDIKKHGGEVFSQDEESAEFPSMPSHAVETGLVDYIGTPGELASRLVNLILTPTEKIAGDNIGISSDGKSHFLNKIFEIVKVFSDVDFTNYKKTTLERRILRRMEIQHTQSLSEYYSLLSSNSEEVESLYKDLLINVTNFFRNPEVFESIYQDVIPNLLERQKSNEPIRIWIPACSSGEEAYSYAIIFFEYLQKHNIYAEFKIFATDISNDVIEVARKGIYSSEIESHVSKERLKAYFKHLASGEYQISKHIRDSCVFAIHNLATNPPFSRMDLISCRNILIYFEQTLQHKIISRLHYGLRANGFLVLGNSETLGRHAKEFSTIHKLNRIYRKKRTNTREASEAVIDFDTPNLASISQFKNTHTMQESENVLKKAESIIMNYLSPVGIVISEDCNIVHITGNASDFLVPPAGSPTYNLLKMCKQPLRMPLLSLIRKSKECGGPLNREGVILSEENKTSYVDISIYPFRIKNDSSLFFIVGLKKKYSPIDRNKIQKKAALDKDSKTLLEFQNHYLEQLENELSETREYLHSVVEEYEVTNEELKASSEEIISSNEEIQSSNEELQTAKEEVQSTNEELRTLNNELKFRNEELSVANDDLNNLLTSIQIPFLILNADLGIRRFSPAAKRLLRLIPSDIGRPISDINPHLKLPNFKYMINEVIATMQPCSKEVIDKDGRWYLMNILPYKTEERVIDGAVVSFAEITEQKNEEEKFRFIIEAMPALVVVHNQDTGLIVLANEKIQTLSGYAESEILDQSINMLMPTYSKKNTEKSCITNLLHKNGLAIQVDVTSEEVVINNKNYIISSLIDLTEKEKLIERGKVIIESVPFPLLLIDHEGYIIQTNTAAQNLFGYDENEFNGKNENMLLPERLRKRHAQTRETIVNSHKLMDEEDIETTAVRKDGTEFPAQIRFNLVDTSDDIVISCSVKDISNEKDLILKRDQAISENAEKSSFLANMSHEIRTPLSAITGYTELLESQPNLPKEKQRAYIQTIQKSGTHLFQLINDILDLAKLESGGITEQKGTLNLNNEIELVLNPFKLLADEKNIKLEVSYGPGIPDLVMSDPTRLRQVLYNLIGNALKFTEKGHVTLKINYSQENSTLHFLVEDTGCGIDEEKHNTVFSPFCQADDSTTRVYGGTGLGLTLSRKIAQLLGGNLVLVKSELNVGSIFEFSLPVQIPPSLTLTETIKNKIRPTNTKKYEKLQGKLYGVDVLLVEDSTDIQRLFIEILMFASADVHLAENGKQALKRASERHYDIILMDMQIPKIDGYTVTTILRTNGYSGPIIALTAHALEEDKNRCLKSGCNDYYTKPISSERLIELVYNWTLGKSINNGNHPQ